MKNDLFFTHRLRNGKVEIIREEIINAEKALNNLKTKLKDDGILIITDHFAKSGSGYRAANDLHRIDPNIVKYQLEQAALFTSLEKQ